SSIDAHTSCGILTATFSSSSSSRYIFKTPSCQECLPRPLLSVKRFATEGWRHGDRGLRAVSSDVRTRQSRRRGHPAKAVAYLRVSTADQKLGPEAQRRAIETWAAGSDVEVVAWHADQGISGGSDLDDRPGLVAALAEL